MQGTAVDVSTDWLYRGKRKGNSGGSNGGSSGSGRRARSRSISNAALSQGGVESSPEVAAQEPSGTRPRQGKNRSLSVTTSELKRSNSLGERSKKSLFGSLFGKRGGSPTLKEPSSPEVRPVAPPSGVPQPERIVLNKKPIGAPELPIQELSRLQLKRVTFAVNEFKSDPAQQLPSRKPRIGKVAVPHDMISEVPSISQGITTNGGGTASTAVSPITRDSKEYKMALEEYKRAAKESLKHQQEAHYAAQRIAHEVANFKNNATPTAQAKAAPVPHTEIDTKIAKLSIDKPIHMHEYHFEQEPSSQSKEEEVTLDVVYTRCCHLREILPIPSTLRQVKGKTAPLHTLKFLNPKPTLIDILSFCDFISVVPINTVIFDKVALTPEMFKIVIISLVNSTSLEKLGLRNVNIDHDGWKVLCKFLLVNKSITKLDISQTKLRPDSPEECHRENMDWSLFAEVLRKRTGRHLEELLLNGIKFSKLPIEVFQNLLDAFGHRENLVVPLKLGLATSEISDDLLKFLLVWISENLVQGVDLSFNDLSNSVKTIVGKLSALQLENLEYFTLNSTNISTAYDMALILKYLSTLPNLKFLDLSNLPQVFPEVLPYMLKYLPRFPRLNRIHVDCDGLSFKDISLVCSILGKCKSLTHVSMISQNNTSEIADEGDAESQKLRTFLRNALSVTLYAFVRDSPNLVALDFDYENVSDEIKSRIALILVRNMNRIMDSNFHLDDASSQDELLFDGSLMTETAEDMLERLENKELMKGDATKRYLTKKYFEKLTKLHHKVQSTIDEMFEKRSSGGLLLQEKENLVRLLLLEKNLANILEIFSNIPHLSLLLGSNCITLPSLKHVGSENAVSNPSSADQEFSQRPHIMATDSGRIIDVITGKPLVREDASATFTLSKRQEEEEGELHKWGFFVQQQRSIYPESETRTLVGSQTSADSTQMISPPSLASSSSSSTELKTTGQPKLLAKIPSGAELRDAIIKAKGIESIDDLIKSVNSDQVELETIYGGPLKPSHFPKSAATVASTDVGATDQNYDANTDDTVKQSYDKLLNDLKMDRPPKKPNASPTND
ncbi:hypothetical protein HG537_0F02220 [Torulaspora globosa]|uniref:Uncharacterized protein n=1 Tax=Torulaspora globosa TaxID=48254 RepID=A0A7H9HVQ3_9SACH|nr:hypothetical protein HG537_0F02220 [Torulaspora sp. CBS 2947]